MLDSFGLQLNPVGQWLVRTLSGEGESIFEGIYALRQRLRGVQSGMAEAYGWGKLVGMTAPWKRLPLICAGSHPSSVYGQNGCAGGGQVWDEVKR